MAQNIVEIVTVVAIALISLIFAVYLIILKKNGWFSGKSDFYRCPNQECKKIFQKPIELKDLSESPPRIYPACPECGANLDLFFGSSTKKMSKIRDKTFFLKKKPKTKLTEKKAEVRKVEEPNMHQSQKSTLKEKVPATKPIMDRKKADAADDFECRYYFGYLASREKQEDIPDICLECPRSLDCMLFNCKLGNSAAEISKWYYVKV